MEHHVPSHEAGFRCSMGDMKESRQADQHFRLETEAKRFAIELLAPPGRFEGCLNSEPDLEHVRQLAGGLDLSKEATARRIVELHDAPIAMVFFHDGSVRYFDKSDEFPFLMAKKGSLLPYSVEPNRPAGTLTDVVEADPEDWLDGPIKGEFRVQTLYQRDGYGITMLILELDDPDDGGPEDTYKRYTRWG